MWCSTLCTRGYGSVALAPHNIIDITRTLTSSKCCLSLWMFLEIFRIFEIFKFFKNFLDKYEEIDKYV